MPARTPPGEDTTGTPDPGPGTPTGRGLVEIAVRVRRQARDDNLVLIAAGVAFFSLLALAPALLAAVSIYGLVASPADVSRQVGAMSGVMPEEVRQLIQDQLTQVVETSSGRLGLQAFIGTVVALWAASSAVKHLAVALSAIFDEHEHRGYLRLRAMALAVTVGAIVFLLVALALLAGGSEWIERNMSHTVGEVLRFARWPLLAALMMTALALAYRHLPDRETARVHWVSWGAAVATGLWLLASVGFAEYSSRFGNYQKIYGSMAAVVITMLWLFITAFCVLLGAQINVELEHPSERRSTS